MNDKLKLPVTGEYLRGTGTLIKIEEIPVEPVPPPNVDYIFEEITAHCQIRLGKDVLNKFNNVWDHYGKETSVEDAVSAAKKYAKKHNLGKNSDVEVVAIKVVEQVRKRPTRQADNYYDKSYFQFEELPCGSKRSVSERVETIAWSSKT